MCSETRFHCNARGWSAHAHPHISRDDRPCIGYLMSQTPKRTVLSRSRMVFSYFSPLVALLDGVPRSLRVASYLPSSRSTGDVEDSSRLGIRPRTRQSSLVPPNELVFLCMEASVRMDFDQRQRKLVWRFVWRRCRKQPNTQCSCTHAQLQTHRSVHLSLIHISEPTRPY